MADDAAVPVRLFPQGSELKLPPYPRPRVVPPPPKYQALEAAIDEITESYDRGDPIDSLESAALPNRRRCIEALQELEPLLFMGFYATSPLHRDNLRHRVAEHAHRAHDMLVDQIARALTYHHWVGRDSGARKVTPTSSEDIVVELFREIPKIRRLLATDVRAAFDSDPAAESIEDVVFSYPSITAVATYRIAHELFKRGVPMIPRILTEHAHAVTGIDIHPGAQIGEGFFIDHGTGVVIGATAVIGDQVKLYQGVTLGALSVPNRGDDKKRHPTLEDRVTVYAGATILGGDTVVGEGTVVGANVWLMESTAPGAKVFGGPKRQI